MKEKRLEELQNFLEESTYPRGLIQAGINRAKSKRTNQEELQNPIEKTNKKIITFTTTYNPKNPDFFQTIKSNIPILQNDEILEPLWKIIKLLKVTSSQKI